MAHLASFKAGGAAGVLKHDERKEGDKVEHRKNESIDPNRTAQNYNLAPARHGRLMEHIKRVCDENNVHLSNRKDLNVMCSWVITAPKELQAAEIPKFFYFCYKFLNERYGEKYVLSATVHLDETTPHLHYSFIPVGYDDKNERFTVSSKRVATRTELQRFHKDLGTYMSEVFGRDIGIENGETAKKGNRTTEELKYQSAVERREKAEQAAEQAEIRLSDLEGRVLTAEQVNALNGKKTITGGLKGISYEEYLSLKKTAESVDRAKSTVKKLKNSNAVKDRKISELNNQLKFLPQQLRKEFEDEYYGKYHYLRLENYEPTDVQRICDECICQFKIKDNNALFKFPISEAKKADEIFAEIKERKQQRFPINREQFNKNARIIAEKQQGSQQLPPKKFRGPSL